MANLENIKVLADAAYQGKNFEQSYAYYSQILEQEIENPVAWVRKGVSAAHLSNIDAARLNETKLLIAKGREIGIDDAEAKTTANFLREAYESLFTRQQKSLFDNVKDHQKVAMPQGGSALLHMFGQALNKTVALQSLTPAFLKSHELLLLMCEINSSDTNLRYARDAINRLLDHSKQNSEYLEAHGDREMLEKLKSANTRFNASVAAMPPVLTPTSSQASGASVEGKGVDGKSSRRSGGLVGAVFFSFIAAFFLSALLVALSRTAVSSDYAGFLGAVERHSFWMSWVVLLFVFMRRRNKAR